MSVEPDGTIVATVEVAATAEAIRGVLDDPMAVSRLSPDVLSTTEVPGAPAGCQRLARETRGLFRPLKMSLQRCRTETGWREELVSSEDFEAYASAWSLTPSATGTRIEYRVRTDVNLPVPRAALTAAIKDAAATTVKNLVAAVLPTGN